MGSITAERYTGQQGSADGDDVDRKARPPPGPRQQQITAKHVATNNVTANQAIIADSVTTGGGARNGLRLVWRRSYLRPLGHPSPLASYDSKIGLRRIGRGRAPGIAFQESNGFDRRVNWICCEFSGRKAIGREAAIVGGNFRKRLRAGRDRPRLVSPCLLGWRVWCQSIGIVAITPADRGTGQRSKTQSPPRCCVPTTDHGDAQSENYLGRDARLRRLRPVGLLL